MSQKAMAALLKRSLDANGDEKAKKKFFGVKRRNKRNTQKLSRKKNRK